MFDRFLRPRQRINVLRSLFSPLLHCRTFDTSGARKRKSRADYVLLFACVLLSQIRLLATLCRRSADVERRASARKMRPFVSHAASIFATQCAPTVLRTQNAVDELGDAFEAASGSLISVERSAVRTEQVIRDTARATTHNEPLIGMYKRSESERVVLANCDWPRREWRRRRRARDAACAGGACGGRSRRIAMRMQRTHSNCARRLKLCCAREPEQFNSRSRSRRTHCSSVVGSLFCSLAPVCFSSRSSRALIACQLNCSRTNTQHAASCRVRRPRTVARLCVAFFEHNPCARVELFVGAVLAAATQNAKRVCTSSSSRDSSLRA